ncbi:MAG: hypothetical protein ABI411_02295 [Tahibacter sp.]
MRALRTLVLVGALLSSGCEVGATRVDSQGAAGLTALAGDYNNYGEVWAAREAAKAGSGLGVPPLVRNTLRVASRSDDMLLWRMVQETEPQHDARWLFRVAGDSLIPYRPLTDGARAAVANETADAFKFDADEWAALEPCALKRERRADGWVATADKAACSAMYPGLGADAALLPLRFELSADSLRVTTVADQARGADAATISRRLRTFHGWQAINGGGPSARPDNNDWHVRRDLVLHNGGSHIALRWRDQQAAGYSIELARLNYKESGAEVLRLAVIEDATGRIVSYVWADPGAQRIGLNLGWLQIGLEQVGLAPEPRKR